MPLPSIKRSRKRLKKPKLKELMIDQALSQARMIMESMCFFLTKRPTEWDGTIKHKLNIVSSTLWTLSEHQGIDEQPNSQCKEIPRRLLMPTLDCCVRNQSKSENKSETLSHTREDKTIKFSLMKYLPCCLAEILNAWR